MTSSGAAPTHVWQIEPGEYLRMERRRGRRHAFETLTPSRTALVVVDMVTFHVAELPYAMGIVPTVRRLAVAVRAAGGTVAWVVPKRVEPRPVDVERLGAEVAERYARAGAGGPPRNRVWPDLGVQDADLVVEKSCYSALFPGSSTLQERLVERGVDTVLVAGTLTNVCCEATARDAQTLGYRVVMVADGCAAVRDRDHNATLHTVYRSYGDVRPLADVLRLVAAS